MAFLIPGIIIIGVIVLFRILGNYIPAIDLFNQDVVNIVRIIWHRYLKQLGITIVLLLTLSFLLTVATFAYGTPKLTTMTLVMLTLTFIVLVNILESTPSTQAMGNQVRNGLGSLLMLIITLIAINQYLVLTHGTGVFSGNTQNNLFFITLIVAFFLAGVLLKTPAEKFWKLCRFVLIVLVMLYLGGLGALHWTPSGEALVRKWQVNQANNITRTNLETKRAENVGQALKEFEKQIRDQHSTDMFIDLRSKDYFIRTLPVLDEYGREMDIVEHAEPVIVRWDKIKEFPNLSSMWDDRQWIYIQKSDWRGVGVEGYIPLRKGVSPDGKTPLYFIVEYKPEPLSEPQFMTVTELGVQYELYRGNFVERVVGGQPLTLKADTKVLVLTDNEKVDPLSMETMIQIIIENQFGEYRGNPIWFLKRKLDYPPPPGTSSGGRTTTIREKILIIDGSNRWIVDVGTISDPIQPLPGFTFPRNGEQNYFAILNESGGDPPDGVTVHLFFKDSTGAYQFSGLHPLGTNKSRHRLNGSAATQNREVGIKAFR